MASSTTPQPVPPKVTLPTVDTEAASGTVDADARLIYAYHIMGHTLPPPFPVDAIFCLCSLDLRVAVRAAELWLSGLAPLLIFSGGVGVLTLGKYGEMSEAEAFAAVAERMGVPRTAILVEGKSTNTGENVRFTYDLLRQREEEGLGRMPRGLVLVQKPYMERRTFATFMRQWPGNERLNGDHGEEASGTRFAVTSPQLGFDEYFDAENPKELVINIMVGDLVRIREYPAKGFQIEQEIPDDVWEAGQRLIKAGYDRHLP